MSNKLNDTKKITLATVKSFAKRNSDKLFVKEVSSFDGMTDCVESLNRDWRKSSILKDQKYYKTNIDGVYTVGSSRDYFTKYEDSLYIGIEVYNCCGRSIIAVKK